MEDRVVIEPAGGARGAHRRGGALEHDQAGGEVEVMRHGDRYPNYNAYGTASYYKTATMLVALRGVLGRELFHKAFTEYGRRWESSPYLGLWFSILLRPALTLRDSAKLTRRLAEAVAATIVRMFRISVGGPSSQERARVSAALNPYGATSRPPRNPAKHGQSTVIGRRRRRLLADR